ncbi:MAG TPA: aminotransferase class IV [Candidatus Limnocylindrales bacterium]|nr:aminotransferase class IV [Candidatus Limnocylindrales bacterium]
MTTEIHWIWLDGELLPADGRHLSVYDRGFQLGDGVFETMRARAGHVTELDEHLERLRHSADGLSIHLAPEADAVIRAGVAGLLRATDLDGPDGDASLRITVSRGAVRARGLLPVGESVAPTVAIQAWPVSPAPADHLERGLHLIASRVRRDPESPLAALKTTSRADYVHARFEARHAGADDALFLTIDGHLSEATSANLFIVRAPRSPSGGRGTGPTELATPALACAILPGTTRSWLLGWAARVGLRPTEGWLTTRDLLDADEAFLCSSVAGVLPVTRYEDEAIGDGTPGPWTARARAAREAFVRGEPEPRTEPPEGRPEPSSS